MAIVKTKAEYELMKKDILTKIDKFLLDYGDFTRKTAPKHWRGTSNVYQALNKAKKDIPEYDPLEMKHLEHDWVRDDVLTDEEKELYDATTKYNI